MGQRIQIRSLIGTRREGRPAADLPATASDTMPVWRNLCALYAERLSDLFARDAAVECEIAGSDEAEERRSAERPGLLLPLGDGATLRIPGHGGRLISDLLLRGGTVAQEDPDERDGLFLLPVVEELLALIHRAFGAHLRVEGEPLLRWPLQAPSSDRRVRVAFAVTCGDISFEIHLNLPAGHAIHAGRAARTSLSDAVPLVASGVISHWLADVSDLLDLHPGTAIVIPGGDLGSVHLEVAGGGSPARTVARGELGTVRGRHAIRIAAVQPAP